VLPDPTPNWQISRLVTSLVFHYRPLLQRLTDLGGYVSLLELNSISNLHAENKQTGDGHFLCL
jgi:hypothetical protein